MRVNLRKLLIIGGILFLLWLVASYSPTTEQHKAIPSKKSVNDIEKKILKLQLEVATQLADSNILMQKVKKLQNQQRTAHLKQETEDENVVQNATNPILPVLVIACDRVTVKRCLDNLVKFRPNKETFPIIISQDCGHDATYEVIKSFTNIDPTITVVQQPDLSEIMLPKPKVKFRGYYKISRHYKFALNYVFKKLGHEAVIIVEDDLDVSPDFFEYFQGTYPLLLKDDSLWCISAWNDNGKTNVIDMSRPELLHRTDFFPGLGWLLRRDTWEQLEPNWPPAFFDDWLRDPKNTQGRACIRPEISRTYSFGKVGVSKGLFFDLHLRNIQLNTEYVEFTKLDLSYLLKDIYDPALFGAVAALPQLSADEAGGRAGARAARVPYSDAKSYQRAAKILGLMDDFRSGVPRTAYLGIVRCFVRGRSVYLVPDYPWEKYDPKWG